MPYFSKISGTPGQLTADGMCPVKVSWEYPAWDTPDMVEIYHDFNPAQLIGRYPSSTKETTISLGVALFSGLILVPRSVQSGQLQDQTTLDSGQQVYWEALQDKYIVPLPTPTSPAPRSISPPLKPVIRRIEVTDGALNVIWAPTESRVDIDGYQIVFVENGQHLPWHKVKDDVRSFRFMPTKGGATYDVGVRAYNDVLTLPIFEKKTFWSEWDWQRAIVSEQLGWPPNGQWQTYEFRPEGSTAQAGGIASVSRAPDSMEVFWISHIPKIPFGRLQGAVYTDKSGWVFYDLPFFAMAASTGSVGATSRQPNTVEVWWTGLGGSIEHAYFYEGQGWKGNQLAPVGSIAQTSELAAVSRAPTTMELWWVRPDGGVNGAYWYETGGGWKTYELARAGSAAITGRLTATSREVDHMEVFWVSPDGAIKHAYWSEKQGWNQGELAGRDSASIQSSITATTRNQHNLEVYWIGSAGAVQRAHWGQTQGWLLQEIAPRGIAALTSPIMAVSRASNTVEVFWLSILGDLHNAWWYEGGSPEQFGTGVVAQRRYILGGQGLTAVSRYEGTIELWYVSRTGTIEAAYIYF